MEVSNLDFVKLFHKIGTSTGPRRRTVPPSWADPISCVSPNLLRNLFNLNGKMTGYVTLCGSV